MGHYKLLLTVGGDAVNGSPFIVVVDAGVVDPATCTASGDGLHTSNVGEPTFFEVLAKDKGGNRSLTGGSAVTSFLQGPEKVFFEHYLHTFYLYAYMMIGGCSRY